MGAFALVEREDGSLRTGWVGRLGLDRAELGVEDPSLRPLLVRDLTRYFAGENVDFSDVELPGGPAFFSACWEAARRIPRGQTRSYAELAVMAGGKASAARAAGQAMRSNPVPILVPCHRVIASGGGIGGFGGSREAEGFELNLKRRLLALERPEASRND